MIFKKKENLEMNQKGFTLSEMMVSLGISTVIIYTVFVAMRVTGNEVDTANVKMTTQTSAREGLYRMTQEIRTSAADQITIGNSGSSITFYVPDPSSPVDASYQTNWGHQIKYALGSGSNATKLIRTDLTANTTKVMANDVTGITFTGNSSSPTLVTVSMSLQRALANGRNVTSSAMTITGQAKVRNASSGGDEDEDEDEDDGSGDDHGSDDDSSGDDHGSDDDHS